MAVLLPRAPLWIQTKGYSARDDREILTISGAGVVQGLAVTAGPGMAVTVGPGLAVVPGTRNVGQGNYGARIDTSVTVPWPAASASPRTDTLYMQVLDNSEILAAGGSPVSQEGVILDVAQGTSVVPSDSLIIATVAVPASASSIVAGNITFGLVARAQGTKPVTANVLNPTATNVTSGSDPVQAAIASGVVSMPVGTYWMRIVTAARWSSGSTWLGASVQVKIGSITILNGLYTMLQEGHYVNSVGSSIPYVQAVDAEGIVTVASGGALDIYGTSAGNGAVRFGGLGTQYSLIAHPV